MRSAPKLVFASAMAVIGQVGACAPSRTEIVGYVQARSVEGRGGASVELDGGRGTPGTGGSTGASAEDAAGGMAGAGGSGGIAGSGGGAGGMVAGGAGGTGGMMGGASPMADAGPTAVMGRFRMLVFSRTAGFRHDSIPSGLNMLRALALANDFEITPTEDPAQFTDQTLAPYQVIFFLNTTDDILNADQQAAMERFIRAGKGFAGVHAAGDTEDGFGWAWYEELMGSTYTTHSPQGQSGTIRIEPTAMNHPIIRAVVAKGMMNTWQRNEEWYYFKRNVTGVAGVRVLLRATSPGLMGAGQQDWPHSWVRDWESGRAFYFASGHAASSFDEPLFREYVLQGVLWASGRLQ